MLSQARFFSLWKNCIWNFDITWYGGVDFNYIELFRLAKNAKILLFIIRDVFRKFFENYQVYCVSEQKIKANTNELCFSVQPFIIALRDTERERQQREKELRTLLWWTMNVCCPVSLDFVPFSLHTDSICTIIMRKNDTFHLIFSLSPVASTTTTRLDNEN